MCLNNIMQLKLMCIMSVGSHGYQAYKYIPYGRVSEVMPYLVRRANENRAIMDTAKDERKVVRRELFRRIFI